MIIRDMPLSLIILQKIKENTGKNKK